MTPRKKCEFKWIALTAIVITIGCLTAAPARSDTISHVGLPSILHDVRPSSAGGNPDVAVSTPSPPAAQNFNEDGLYQFIVHHATTHYVTTPTTRNLARWRGGKQSICPRTAGLEPRDNALVTARIRAVAAYVGAPLQSNPQCKDNVQILFTSNPTKPMNEVLKWATSTATFGVRYSGGERDLLGYRDGEPIQGWYITTRGGAIVLNTDVALVGLDVLPVWPRITQNYLGSGAFATRLGGSHEEESGIGIGSVFLVVDTTKTGNYGMRTLADYLAMLTLSVAQSPDHCDPLPSILDLIASSCGTREKPVAMTAGDLAFLKALYYRDTGLDPSLSRAEIKDNMMRQWDGHEAALR